MSDTDRRRHKRYTIDVAGELVIGRNTIQVATLDVSFGGVFVRFAGETREEPRLPLRQLARLHLSLPPSEHSFSCHVMTVHDIVGANEHGFDAGVGLQMFAADRKAEALWAEFMRYVQLRCFEAVRKRRPAPRPESLHGPARREFRRSPGSLELRLKTTDELHNVWTSNVSVGGMFIATELALKKDSSVTIEVVHPETLDRFPLNAIVRWCSEHPLTAGVGVEFVDIDDARRCEFVEFISSEEVCFDAIASEKENIDETVRVQTELLAVIESLPGMPPMAPIRGSIVEIGLGGLTLEAAMPIEHQQVLVRCTLQGGSAPLQLWCHGRVLLDEDLLQYTFTFEDLSPGDFEQVQAMVGVQTSSTTRGTQR